MGSRGHVKLQATSVGGIAHRSGVSVHARDTRTAVTDEVHRRGNRGQVGTMDYTREDVRSGRRGRLNWTSKMDKSP